MSQAKREEWAIYVTVFTCGTCLMCLEIAGSRVLAPFFGSTIFVWGSLIGVFMAALSCGYYLGGKLSDLKPQLRVLLGLAAGAGLFIIVLPTFEMGVCHAIQRARWGPRMGPLASSVVLFLVPSVLLGMVSPFAIRLCAKELAGVGNVAGRLYALSTVGSIAGTIGTAFWLIPALGTQKIIFALGGVLVFVACASFIFSAGWRGRMREGAAATVAVLALAALAFGWMAALPAAAVAAVCAYLARARFRETAAAAAVTLLLGSASYPAGPGAVLTEPWEEDTPHTLIDWKDSAYHLILVTEQDREMPDGTRRKRRLLRFNDRVESAIYIDREGEGRSLSYDDFESAVGYTYLLHLARVFNRDARSVLFVGMGGGVAPTEFASRYGMDVEIVEIDPEVERFARDYFHLHPEVKVTIEDGREYLRRSDKTFDVIVLDAYSSGGQIPFHLTTVEFLRLVRSRLNAGGIVVSNLISALEGKMSGIYRAEYKTFHAAGFENVYTFPKTKEDRGRGTGRVYRHRAINIIVVATQEEERLSKKDIVLRADELVAKGEAIAKLGSLARDYRAQSPRPGEVLARMGDVPVLTDDYAPVETLYFE